MSKLINTYRKLPSISNRRKLQACLDKKPYARCFLDAAETEFLKANGFIF